MALTLTLADSLNLTTDTLQAGVIETLATESKILADIPFMNIEGSAYSYNVETELSEVKFRKVGDPIIPGKPEFKPATAALKILGDEAIVDTFQAKVHGNINDLMAIEVHLKAKAVSHKFEKTFIAGDSVKNEDEFDGIDKLMAADQKVAATAVIADDVDYLLDLIQGEADVLVMNKKTRRKFVAENRSYITYTQNKFGAKLAVYGDTPIMDLESEILAEDGVIYALKYGAKEGVCGLTNGGVTTNYLGEVDNAPQLKTRIEWFVGLAVFNDKTVSKREAPLP